MSGKYLYSRQNTPQRGYPSFVTITHLYHPLMGQKLELVRVPRTARSRLLVRHPEGRCFHIPREWTDFEAPEAKQTEASDVHLLEINGLCALAEIVEDIITESSTPESP